MPVKQSSSFTPSLITSPNPRLLTAATNPKSSSIAQHLLHASIKSSFPSSQQSIPHESPKTLSDLQRTIHVAKTRLRRLKPTTNPSSPSSISAHKAGVLLVDTSHLTAVTTGKHTVTAQCGVRLTQLPLPFVVPDVSVGAALADGTLALGGFAEGLVADCLQAISLVDSRGRLRMYKSDDPTGIFKAIKLSLGLFGIIYDATFSASRVERVVAVALRPRAMSEVVTTLGLKHVVDGHTAAEISWVPFNSYNTGDDWLPCNDNLIVKTVKTTNRAFAPGRGVRYVAIPEYLSRNCAELAAEGYEQFQPSHTREILSLGFNCSSQEYVTTLREAVKEEYDHCRTVEESVCFGLRLRIEEDWERIVRAWETCTDVVKKAADTEEYPLNMMLRMRFVGGSDALLAPNESSTGCVMTIASAVGTAGWEGFARAVVAEWTGMGGRWVVKRGGVGSVEEASVKMLKRLVRNGGLDDYGMFEDFVSGGDSGVDLERLERMREISLISRRSGFGDVADVADVAFVEDMSFASEMRWVLVYVLVYLVVWCWLFGEDAIATIRQYK